MPVGEWDTIKSKDEKPPPLSIPVNEQVDYKKHFELKENNDEGIGRLHKGRLRVTNAERLGLKEKSEAEKCYPWWVDGVKKFRAQMAWARDDAKDAGGAMSYFASMHG